MHQIQTYELPFTIHLSYSVFILGVNVHTLSKFLVHCSLKAPVSVKMHKYVWYIDAASENRMLFWFSVDVAKRVYKTGCTFVSPKVWCSCSRLLKSHVAVVCCVVSLPTRELVLVSALSARAGEFGTSCNIFALISFHWALFPRGACSLTEK